MRIVTARWGARNVLEVKCGCGASFDYPADRWRVVCPACGRKAYLSTLREEYARRGDG